MKPQGGCTATRSGRKGEQLFEEVLVALGFQRINMNFATESLFMPDNSFVIHPNGFTDIIGKPWRIDFLIHFHNNQRLLVEVKIQDTQGSTDDKIYMVVHSLQNLKNEETLLVVIGIGFRKKIITWAKNQATPQMHVLTEWGHVKKFLKRKMNK